MLDIFAKYEYDLQEPGCKEEPRLHLWEATAYTEEQEQVLLDRLLYLNKIAERCFPGIVFVCRERFYVDNPRPPLVLDPDFEDEPIVLDPDEYDDDEVCIAADPSTPFSEKGEEMAWNFELKSGVPVSLFFKDDDDEEEDDDRLF